MQQALIAYSQALDWDEKLGGPSRRPPSFNRQRHVSVHLWACLNKHPQTRLSTTHGTASPDCRSSQGWLTCGLGRQSQAVSCVVLGNDALMYFNVSLPYYIVDVNC